MPQKDLLKILENLSNDEQLKKLQDLLDKKEKENNEKINIFKILKLDNFEIRHSNFIAWLLNPKETHKLEDKFLKKFLKEVQVNFSINTSNIQVEREYSTDKGRKIDILLYNEDFVCVIENKYGSCEHDNQCSEYKKYVEKKFKDRKYKLFLYLDFYHPKKEIEGYSYITYEKIQNILYEILNDIKTDETILKSIIEQYIEIIKEKYPMQDEEITQLCREIYSKYSTAIDVIQKNIDFDNDSKKTEIYKILQEILLDMQKKGEIEILEEAEKAIKILPKGVDKNKLKGCSYMPDEVLSCIHFINFAYNKCLYIEICIAEADEGLEKRRKKIKELLEKIPLKFNGKDTWNYTRYKKLIDLEEYEELNNRQEIKEHIEDKIKETDYINKFKKALSELNE